MMWPGYLASTHIAGQKGVPAGIDPDSIDVFYDTPNISAL
jgi:hypothetical protein